MPDIARPLGEQTFSMPEIKSSPEVIEHNKEISTSQESKREDIPASAPESSSTDLAVVTPIPTAIVSITKTPLRRDIEKILEEDLRFLYLELVPARQEIFRQQGEITASRIEYLLNRTKVQISYMVYLIRRWLMLIPGVNRYFLEQESKIKAEKILFLNAKE